MGESLWWNISNNTFDGEYEITSCWLILNHSLVSLSLRIPHFILNLYICRLLNACSSIMLQNVQALFHCTHDQKKKLLLVASLRTIDSCFELWKNSRNVHIVSTLLFPFLTICLCWTNEYPPLSDTSFKVVFKTEKRITQIIT